MALYNHQQIQLLAGVFRFLVGGGFHQALPSFFGLVEQVAWAFSKKTVMLPVREILSPKSKSLWTADLQQALEKAKEIIVE